MNIDNPTEVSNGPTATGCEAIEELFRRRPDLKELWDKSIEHQTIDCGSFDDKPAEAA